MTNKTQPFDDQFSAIRARIKAATGSEGMTAWYDGKVHMTLKEWDRLATAIETGLAARQPAPVVGDEELVEIYYAAYEGQFFPNGMSATEGQRLARLAGIRAVREALAAQAVQVPDELQIPEGWKMQSVYPLAYPEGHLLAWLITTGPNYKEALGSGPEWHDALRAAIKQAKGGS